MKKASWILVAVVAVGVMLVAALFAPSVGGARIRSASRFHSFGSLTTTRALVPGVPVTVGVAGVAESGDVLLAVRVATQNIPVRRVTSEEMQQGSWQVVLPCLFEVADSARLVLLDGGTRAVVAQSVALTVLPAGPDCAL